MICFHLLHGQLIALISYSTGKTLINQSTLNELTSNKKKVKKIEIISIIICWYANEQLGSIPAQGRNNSQEEEEEEAEEDDDDDEGEEEEEDDDFGLVFG